MQGRSLEVKWSKLGQGGIKIENVQDIIPNAQKLWLFDKIRTPPQLVNIQ